MNRPPVLARAAGAIALATVTALGGMVAPPTVSAATVESPYVNPAEGLRNVLWVGNNWEGTADAVHPDGDFHRIARINIIPDRNERLVEIHRDPARLALYYGIRQMVGEGHDQYVDDMYSTKDGRNLIVSRPSFADVVSIDIVTGEIAWRFPVQGFRSDHMAVSPDGSQVAVSASTAKLVHVLDTATGREIGTFPSGDNAHENTYIKGGTQIVNESIGNVWTPLDQPWADVTKGERVLQFVDAETLQVIKRVDLRARLAEAGRPELSIGVRPMTFSPDYRFMYFQVSFFHGFIEYDIDADEITRIVDLPITPAGDVPREAHLLDSGHHGISMNPQGTKICVAGTMSDYATVVDRDTMQHGPLVSTGLKSYWVTTDLTGEHCFVSWAKSDKVSVLSFETGEEVAQIPVGYHPQRMRIGVAPQDWSGNPVPLPAPGNPLPVFS